MDQCTAEKPFDKTVTFLAKNGIITIKKSQFTVECLCGIVWVTGPKGMERILSTGQSISGTTDGKVCIMAFSNTRIRIEHKRKRIAWPRFFSKRLRFRANHGGCKSHRRYGGVGDHMLQHISYPS